MALIQCSECGKEISDKAASCPGCGAPVGKNTHPHKVTRTGAKWEGIGFLLIAIAVVAMVAATQNPDSELVVNSANIAPYFILVGLVVFIIGRLIKLI